jgi:hypothetical protein
MGIPKLDEVVNASIMSYPTLYRVVGNPRMSRLTVLRRA